MSDGIVIRVDHLWKSYGLLPALRDRWNRWRSPEEKPGLWALQDVCFEVNRGETLGLIGRNGAGKSTLLKVLAGVTPPTRGKASACGRVFPMIELNAGMHVELTGRENARLLGAIMGLSRREMNQRMPEIEEFTELGEWFDRPVRTYSSGMLARLGFGVAVNITADILLVDEVMSVGDLSFQNRCLERMKELREHDGVSILFVSHSLDMVQYSCPKAITLEAGQIMDYGSSSEVITRYENQVYRHEYARGLSGRIQQSGVFEMESVRILDERGVEVSNIAREQGFTVQFEGRLTLPVHDPLFVFAIVNSRGEQPLWEHFCPKQPINDKVRLRVAVPPLPLSGGRYRVNFALRDRDGYLTHARYLGVASFVVEADQRERGVLTVPLGWKLSNVNQ